MKKKRVITNFAGFRQSELETLGQAIVVALTNNQYFIALGDDVVFVGTVLSDYSKALADARGGNGSSRARKEQLRAALEAALHDLAVKVNLEAGGDEAILKTTAIPLVRDRGAGNGHSDGPLAKVSGVSATPVDGGMLVTAAEVKGASMYLFQCTQAPASPESLWVLGHCPEPSFTFHRLTLGALYAFRVAAMGKDPLLVFSEVVTRHAS